MAVIEIWSDVVCPWASLTLHRLLAERSRSAARFEVRHRFFPLELFNDEPTPRRLHDAEAVEIMRIEPALGWKPWDGPVDSYPVTTLPALEAIAAAQAQSLAAGEQLSTSLRRAYLAESRCISMRHEILAAAVSCRAVDASRLAADLDSGRYRGEVTGDWVAAKGGAASSSGELVLPGGDRWSNPGLGVAWTDGRPSITADDPTIYARIVAGL